MNAAANSIRTASNETGFPPVPPEDSPKANLEVAGGQVGYREALVRAVTQPGVANAAYRAFHRFSVGNQLLAAWQLLDRGLPLSPIASFNRWKENGRSVVKGQKAISLYMPVIVKSKAGATLADAEAGREAPARSVYKLLPRWFSLDQTEGEAFPVEIVVPGWNRALALAALEIAEVPFETVRGTMMGYASGRAISLNPLNPLKHKTRFHELAHVVLGHTEALMVDDAELTMEVAEVEAESVAWLLYPSLSFLRQSREMTSLSLIVRTTADRA